ncbi:hypothetical protein [Flavobacterium subsaxonicum]|uniref:GLPGLI family protein n=1 Tax=Flavobacterium subsaxonicum WB 4.1-42 = DSM 21790 TaxID=1121898 RepID=A0A0A2MDX0_9FLAO|nr:hypothetical protein [Flavobacterium subsaxonicum]KGO90877.1 hypothetical protein Q766_21025 [Flavobacterium subsaxonicum WB 4.1-42 = DSM 21790]
MKQLYAFLLLVLSFNMYSQNYFEGIVEYNVEIKFPDHFKNSNGENIEDIDKLYDTLSNLKKLYYICKNGNYVITPKLNSKVKQLYLSKINTIYFFKDNLVVAANASVDLESTIGKKPTVELLTNESIVNGINCRVVKVAWKLGTYYYYYNSDFLKINNEPFKFHTYDMWNKYLEIAKCLPLKIIKEINGFSTTTLTFKKMKIKSIKNSVFNLPAMNENLELSRYKQPHEKVYIIE